MSLTSAIICRIVFGRRYEDEESERCRFSELLRECETMLGTFFVSDYVPFLGWIDKLTGLEARLERNSKVMDEFFKEVIEEHLDPSRETPEEEDLIDVLLQLKKHRSFSVDLTDDHIKAVSMVCNLEKANDYVYWQSFGKGLQERIEARTRGSVGNWLNHSSYPGW
ncbi:hypothetical protein VNO77_07225 [Canavalia gladiata]|uniref:Uncharacterized protein n=1 Tax=Canavalia gladiata TaxID=3824 RepID=A0AAN9QTA6_CANGL